MKARIPQAVGTRLADARSMITRRYRLISPVACSTQCSPHSFARCVQGDRSIASPLPKSMQTAHPGSGRVMPTEPRKNVRDISPCVLRPTTTIRMMASPPFPCQGPHVADRTPGFAFSRRQREDPRLGPEASAREVPKRHPGALACANVRRLQPLPRRPRTQRRACRVSYVLLTRRWLSWLKSLLWSFERCTAALPLTACSRQALAFSTARVPSPRRLTAGQGHRNVMRPQAGWPAR